MNKVEQLQNGLIRDIFSLEPSNNFDSKGLEVYRRNLRATAVRSLEISFPTVSELIGGDMMKFVAERLLQTSPPAHGDWSLWGEEFADLIENMPEFKEVPYLADCARLDYIVNQLHRSQDSSMELDSLQLLGSNSPNKLEIELAPAMQTIQSIYPLAEIWQAHQHEDETRRQLLALAAEKMNTEEESFILVSRQNHQVKVTSLTKEEFRFFNGICASSISDVIERLDPNLFSFERWLTTAVNQGWIQRIVSIN